MRLSMSALARHDNAVVKSKTVRYSEMVEQTSWSHVEMVGARRAGSRATECAPGTVASPRSRRRLKTSSPERSSRQEAARFQECASRRLMSSELPRFRSAPCTGLRKVLRPIMADLSCARRFVAMSIVRVDLPRRSRDQRHRRRARWEARVGEYALDRSLPQVLCATPCARGWRLGKFEMNDGFLGTSMRSIFPVP